MLSKNKIKKILVALDGSKNSLRGLKMAIYLARQSDTKLTGIHVLPRYPKKEYRKLSYPEKPALLEADKIMEFAKELSAKNGILFEKKIRFGYPDQSIVKYANSENYDMVIIGARGLSGIKEIFLGSVSNYVMHKSTIPVLVVK